MDLSPGGLWESMGTLARIVTILLLAMAVASLAVFIERIVVFVRSIRRSREFAQVSTPVLEARRYEELASLCKKHEGSLLAELVGSGLAVFSRAASDLRNGLPSHVAPVELARRELARRLEGQTARLRRGFPLIASVGSVAPFVGLFGTVVGIITAFQGVGQQGSAGIGAVSGGIAEALAVTAVGLVVAIAAVLGFNFLQTLSERIELALGQAASELGDHLENVHGLQAGGAGGSASATSNGAQAAATGH